jgi:hypothetical protein
VLTSVKELTVFVKMNSVGLVFVAYICSFILYKSYEDPSQIHFELEAPELSLGMAQFGGVMVLSFFVHSAIMSIMKNQKQPEHNGRDLTIAYMLVGLTYALIGGSAYIRFNHEELPQDFLNLFPQNDVTAVIARICLLLQLMTVFPLILYVVRIQFFGYLFNKQYPGRTQVVLLNGTILLCTTLITLYYPKVGDIQRYTGAICGFILIFLMPTSLYISSNYHSLVSFLPYPLFKIQTVNVNSPPQQQQQQQQQQPRKQPSRSQSHSRSAGVEPARQESWGRPVQEESSTISLLSEDHLLSGEVEGNLQQEPVDKSVQSPAEMVDVAAHLLLIVMGLGLAIFNFV